MDRFVTPGRIMRHIENNETSFILPREWDSGSYQRKQRQWLYGKTTSSSLQGIPNVFEVPIKWSSRVQWFTSRESWDGSSYANTGIECIIMDTFILQCGEPNGTKSHMFMFFLFFYSVVWSQIKIDRSICKSKNYEWITCVSKHTWYNITITSTTSILHRIKTYDTLLLSIIYRERKREILDHQATKNKTTAIL